MHGRLTMIRSRERGAILVQVAISIMALMGFAVFVIDYGVVWVARGQAQNAADAGALAGALSRAYDDFDADPVADGRAWMAATQAANANLVWGQSGVAQPSWACPAGEAGRCARVDVYRNGEFGSPMLPVFFGPVVGIMDQGVRASATARVGYGNVANCMRPWAIVDRWTEVHAPAESYDHWDSVGPAVVELPEPDIYTPPDAAGPGTGYRLPEDFGVEVVLKVGDADVAKEELTAGWFLPVDLPDPNGGWIGSRGGDPYRDSIAGCIAGAVRIGQYLPTLAGRKVGPTKQGFDLLVQSDAGASWEPATKTVANSCAPGCAPFSPRIVPLAVFDMDDFQFHRAGGVSPGQAGPWTQCPVGGKCVRVVNILGFFVDRMQGNDVIGYLVRYPGAFVAGEPTVAPGASFLVSVNLIR